jgi:AcrR family transcriptional regulator
MLFARKFSYRKLRVGQGMGDQNVQEPGQPAAKRQRLSAQARRELILRRAKEVFARHSYREASTSKLAEASGITEPMLYKHFGSKQGLFLAVLTHYIEQFIQQWQQRIDQHIQQGLQIALAEIAMDYHATVKADPDVPRVIFQGSAAAADDPAFGQATYHYIMEVYRVFSQLMKQAQEAELIDAEMSPEVAAWGSMSMAFAMQFSLINSPQWNREREEQWQHWMLRAASQVWLRGLHLPTA